MISIIFQKKFEESLPVYFLFSIAILYFGGLLSNLLIGLYALICVSVLGIGLLVFSVIKKHSRSSIIQLILTPGLIAFAILFVFIFIINIGRSYLVWDEFSHWGVMIKEMIRLDKFHSVPDSVLAVHKDYPPAIQLFEYFYNKIAGSYSEPNTFRAIQIFTLSLFLPLFKNLHFKNIIKLVCFLAAIFVIPSLLGINLYNSIYQDVTTGVLFGYALFSVVNAEKFSLFFGINLFLSVFVLTITKQIGLFFVGMVLLFTFIRLINFTNLKNFKVNFKIFIKECIFATIIFSITVVSTFIANKTWGYVITSNKVDDIQFKASNIKLSGMIDVLNGNSPEFQRETLRNFADAFISTKPIVPFLQLTYFQLIIIVTGIGLLFFLAFRRSKFSNTLSAFAISIPIGAFGYAGVMLLLYVFCFDSYEGPILASFERYMSTYWIGIISAIFMLGAVFSTDLTESNNSHNLVSKNTFWVAIFIVICGIVTPNSVYFTILPRNALIQEAKYASQKELALKLNRYIDISNDKVYLISQGDDGLNYWLIKYYSNPVKTNPRFSWSIGTKVSDGDIWTKEMNASEWKKVLVDGNFNYVYVINENDSFRKEFGNLFSSPDESLNGCIFRVNMSNNNEVKLEKINNE